MLPAALIGGGVGGACFGAGGGGDVDTVGGLVVFGGFVLGGVGCVV